MNRDEWRTSMSVSALPKGRRGSRILRIPVVLVPPPLSGLKRSLEEYARMHLKLKRAHTGEAWAVPVDLLKALV